MIITGKLQAADFETVGRVSAPIDDGIGEGRKC